MDDVHYLAVAQFEHIADVPARNPPLVEFQDICVPSLDSLSLCSQVLNLWILDGYFCYSIRSVTALMISSLESIRVGSLE